MALSGEEYELWRRYRVDGDEEARDFLFLQYAPWSRKVAAHVFSRLRVPQIDWSDFAQNATLGLLEAMSRFDPDRGLDFMAYAKLRVQGAVFNGVRVFLTGVDRGTVTHRNQERLASLAPDAEDEPDLLGVLIDTVASLGAGYLLEQSSPSSAEGLQREVENRQLGRLLAGALESLSERERLVLTAHYLNHVPFNVVAAQIGLTKGRVSQLHRSGLINLRRILQAHQHDLDAYL